MIKRQEHITCELPGKTRGYEKSLKCQIKAGKFLERDSEVETRMETCLARIEVRGDVIDFRKIFLFYFSFKR